MYIDTHAHLDDEQFDADRDEMIRRAFENGVEKIINIGAGIGSSERSVELAKNYQNIFASVGLHPEYFMKHETFSQEYKDKIEGLIKKEKVVAVGEIGLDYYNHGNDLAEEGKEWQKKGFLFQLELARKFKKPVILHSRGARDLTAPRFQEKGDVYEDVLAIIEDFADLNFVFHSFGGRLDFAKKVMEKKNMLFSFAGNITYNKPSSEMNEVIKTIPLERMMLDTDAPYLAPVPKRGERNESAFVLYVAQKISEIKDIPLEEVARATKDNAVGFFGL